METLSGFPYRRFALLRVIHNEELPFDCNGWWRARFDSGVGHSDPVSASGRPAGFEPVDGCSIRPTGTKSPRVAQWQCSRPMSGRREFDSQRVDCGRSQVARRKAVTLLSWVRFPPVTPTFTGNAQGAGRSPKPASQGSSPWLPARLDGIASSTAGSPRRQGARLQSELSRVRLSLRPQQ
jgi:hypothetical protein